jgi:serralysin
MATIRSDVPGSGYGNVYVDALIWGDAAWDVSGGPIRLWFGQSSDFSAASAVHGDSDALIYGASARNWTDTEKSAFIRATQVYASVCGLTFTLAGSAADANIVWWKTSIDDETLGFHEPPAYGEASGGQLWGYFNPTMRSWNYMNFGGDGFNTVLHEIGHGLGLAHPHDGGTGSDATTFPGVRDPFSTGTHGLNQGVWTVMSYNTGWDQTSYGLSYGAQGGLGAFDVAALQALYGQNLSTASGDDVYELPTRSPAHGKEGWSCIWDAGGADTISAARGASSVTIDLRAATLRKGDPDAGGFISREIGVAGGFTIANGVLIENATGGSRSDTLIGNWIANTLKGNGGSDVLNGGGGADILNGGGGNDKLYGGSGNDSLTGSAGKDIFVFNTRAAAGTNVDRILDFKVADDSIWLDNNVFTKLGKGSTSGVKFNSDMFVQGTRAHDREDRVIYDSKNGALYYDPDGTGSKYKQVEIATLSKGLHMRSDDLFVV